jgi:hypothetical protein
MMCRSLRRSSVNGASTEQRHGITASLTMDMQQLEKDRATEVGKLLSAIFVACLGALFAYGYLAPLVSG